MQAVTGRHEPLSRLSRSRYRLNLSRIFPSTPRPILSPIVSRAMELARVRGLRAIHSARVIRSYRFLEISRSDKPRIDP